MQWRRERTQRVLQGSTSFLVDTERTFVSKNLDETVHLQYKKREEWIQEVREGELHGTAENRISAPCLVRSSALSFPEKNKYPWTHGCLIVKDESKNSSC